MNEQCECQRTDSFINIGYNDKGEVVITDQNGVHFVTPEIALDIALGILAAIRELKQI